MLHLLTSLALAGSVDRVPEDFATIQRAIDHGTAPVIEVGPGTWKGASVDRPVHLRGSGAVVVGGVRAAGTRAAFAVPDAASGSMIEGFVIDCAASRSLDLGVVGSARMIGSVADSITVRDNTFLGCTQGVTNAGPAVDSCEAAVGGGAYWVVERNEFHGLPTRSDRGVSGGGVGVMIYNATGADVSSNVFTGTVDDRAEFATAGVSVAGCVDCSIAGNSFDVEGATHWFTAVHNGGARVTGAAASQHLLLVDNDVGDTTFPWLDVAFTSRGSVDTMLDRNNGVAYVDHTVCGDGDLRVDLPSPQ